MARKESPAHHLTAIASVAAISLVLAQTIADRLPSSAFASQPYADSSCASSTMVRAREGVVGASRPSDGAEATALRASCFQPRK